MAEINNNGYQSIRDFIQANWQHIELQDEAGTTIIRLSPIDSRVTSIIEGNIVKVSVIIKGSDTDITFPKTFAKSAIFNVATGGQPFSVETFTPFTVESKFDELTVIHNIEVPRV